MENNKARPLAIGLMVLGALIRVTQHWNFAPVGALSLFGGARLRGWQAYLLPLVLMAATDPLLGGYSVATPLVYASFLINVWIGSRLRQTENPLAIGAAAVAGSVQFFLITNFAAWLGFNTYPHTWSGLVSCYVAGIPFFGRTLASDVFYSAVLFGLHAWLSRRVVQNERVIAAHA
ncbi:MAG TPA: DUF6580 family putative transport protein [Candidatus Acidoferrales bacterium]|jgi:hypothetical protein|nr:DUF6580 family putative transport protein [Candidatus Acidoferrales bacterium]